ncbi:MAG TPA: DUF3224 domain-containing protein [Streptosporangiaceae bacterium]|nr:DUF3224 domain-containing protein [Streptosporangiaceae bacterium]
MILVIGGRSKIGAALIADLLGRGQQVRALVRAGEPTGSLPAAAEAVTGDLADEGSLVAAMAGIEKVFLLSSPHPDAVSWHRNAIDAARRTQVQLLVRSSILGADRESPAEFISAHTTCDHYLEDSGLPCVIVRPNLFLQNIPESTIPSIDASGTFYVNAGGARISMVDTRDVAAVAAAVLTEPGHAGARYDVTGPQALSYTDAAAKLTSLMGRRISYVGASDDAVRQALLGAGLTGWFANALVGLYQDYRRSGTGGYAAQVTETIPRLTGRPARSLDDLLGEISPTHPASYLTEVVTMSESAGRPRATAVITVHKYEPSAYDQPAQGPVLTRIHVEESFAGDITGDGVVEFLQAARADGSASFVGIERVTGELSGRRGTFLLQDAGTVQDNIVSGDWFVIPGSGTDELAGLRGEGGFRANLGQDARVHLDYWFE